MACYWRGKLAASASLWHNSHMLCSISLGGMRRPLRSFHCWSLAVLALSSWSGCSKDETHPPMAPCPDAGCGYGASSVIGAGGPTGNAGGGAVSTGGVGGAASGGANTGVTVSGTLKLVMTSGELDPKSAAVANGTFTMRAPAVAGGLLSADVTGPTFSIPGVRVQGGAWVSATAVGSSDLFSGLVAVDAANPTDMVLPMLRRADYETVLLSLPQSLTVKSGTAQVVLRVVDIIKKLPRAGVRVTSAIAERIAYASGPAVWVTDDVGTTSTGAVLLANVQAAVAAPTLATLDLAGTATGAVNIVVQANFMTFVTIAVP